MKPIVIEESAGVFLFNNITKLYLFMRRKDTGIWEGIKGHIEEEESHIDTLNREILEEVGIKDFLIKEKLGITEFKLEKEIVIKIRRIHYYLAETNATKVKLSEEHSEYKWLNFEESLNLIPFQDTKEIFMKIRVK